MPAFMTNEGAVTEIRPPLPGVRSATAVMEKGGLFKAPSTSSQPALSGRSTPCLSIAATSAAKFGVARSETRHEERAKSYRKRIQRRRGGRCCQTNNPAVCPRYAERFPSRDIHESALTGTVCRRADLPLVEFYPASCPDRNVPRITGKSALRRDRSGCGAVTGQKQVADVYDDVAGFTESKIVRGDVRAPLDRQGIRVYRQCASLAICETRIRRVGRITLMEVALRRESCKPSRQQYLRSINTVQHDFSCIDGEVAPFAGEAVDGTDLPAPKHLDPVGLDRYVSERNWGGGTLNKPFTSHYCVETRYRQRSSRFHGYVRHISQRS